MTELFISVGIDVGADFSFMSIALPNHTFVGKPFKITHSNLNSLETVVSKIKEAEKSNSLKARIFLESTGVYHYLLFCVELNNQLIRQGKYGDCVDEIIFKVAAPIKKVKIEYV